MDLGPNMCKKVSLRTEYDCIKVPLHLGGEKLSSTNCFIANISEKYKRSIKKDNWAKFGINIKRLSVTKCGL